MRRPPLLVLVALIALPVLLFHRALFFQEAFLPAEQLQYTAPWKAATPTAAWNVLRFDGITQFYPWRMEVARAWRAGHIPVTNPYAFAAEGGTPLLANSQSAPFYPPNLIFVALGDGALWYGFGLSAALHLLLAVVGTYAFSRTLGRERPAALLSAVTFGLSAPVVCWLALPTFLCAVAWLPWLLLAIHQQRRAVGALCVGMTVLAGHLQIALFVLLTAGAYFLARWWATPNRTVRWLGAGAAAAVIGLALATPQVLPATALSRESHRAAAAKPTWEIYHLWQTNALPPATVAGFVFPDLFGHPNRNGGLYWNATRLPTGQVVSNNYAEWALYLGVLPLLLAVLGALTRRESRFWASVALVTLLMAFGTWANLPFFFLVPGYSQTGNPGRVLVITAFALAQLAAVGLDSLFTASLRQRVATVAAVALIAALGLALAARQAGALGIAWGDALALASDHLGLAMAWLLLSGILLLGARRVPAARREAITAGMVALAALDLFFWGGRYNPTVPARAVYPLTPGIAYLKEHGPNALIAPLNDRWALGGAGPQQSVLPPNGLTVFGLHDLAGYDSLFRKSARDRIEVATGDNPCPPENGNMVFIKTPEAAVALGARFIVAAPDRSVTTDLPLVYEGTDMKIYENPLGSDAPPTDTTLPAPLKLGLGLGGSAVLALLGLALWERRR